MSLRILGGEFKGRILKSPKTSLTRPTPGILRQAVFNICQHHIEGAHFLDLFAGSGAMGLEALSRNAQSATFIEKAPAAARCIRENISLLHLEDRSELLTLDIFQAIQQLKQKKRVFDLIYIDPPYGKIAVEDVLNELKDLLAQGAVIFVEDSSQEKGLAQCPSFLKLKDTRRFGIARLYQFETKK